MMQKEQKKALLYSVGLHVLLVVLLFISAGQSVITPPKGIAIEAEIVDLTQPLSAPKQTQKPEPEPEPTEPEPDPEPEPEPEPEPKPIEPEPEPEPEVKPEPPKPDPAAIKRQQEQAERLKKLEELRKKRQAAEAAADAQKKPEPKQTTPDNKNEEQEPSGPIGTEDGKVGQEPSLLNHYITAIQADVTRQWARPAGTPAGLKCQIKVNQIPGGGVINVTIGSPCNANTVVKNSIINAVKKADPLPYAGFESVFERRLNFIFQYQGD